MRTAAQYRCETQHPKRNERRVDIAIWTVTLIVVATGIIVQWWH